MQTRDWQETFGRGKYEIIVWASTEREKIFLEGAGGKRKLGMGFKEA